MIPYRVHAKFFVKEAGAVSLPAIVPVFHRWIQEHSVDGLLIDVADYKHVPEGPGILLIGHEGDYALDLGGGRPGLLYRRKRPLEGTLQDVLHFVLRQVLQGCHLLEQDPSLPGPLAFHTGEIAIAFADPLRVPNRKASLDLVRGDLEAVLTTLYGAADVRLAWEATDPRLPFTVRTQIANAPDLASLARARAQYA